MKIQKVKLSQVSVNKANPRFIKDAEFDKLINSLLVLPKMLELRPIVVDATMTALGGNMRYRALCAISQYTEKDLRGKLTSINGFGKKTAGEQQSLVDYWLKWIDAPTAPIVVADELSDEEKREFVIKDNVAFGEMDWDIIANEWDTDEVQEWGLHIPIKPTEINIDDFFDAINEGEEKSDAEKLTIIIPGEYAEQKDEIKKLVELAIADYQGISVK